MKGSRLDPRKSEVIASCQSGKSLAEVGKEFGVTQVAIMYFLRKCGVERRSLSEANRLHRQTPEARTKQAERMKGKVLHRRGGKAGRKVPAIRGAGNPQWKGGVTPEHFLIRNSFEYKEWREAVFTRDAYTCVFCGAHTGNGHRVELHADHIQPFATHPELRFDVSNGRTLCAPCHRQTDTYGANFHRNKKGLNADTRL